MGLRVGEFVGEAEGLPVGDMVGTDDGDVEGF